MRDIHLRWITVRERFLAWEPGRRFTFSSDAMSLPLAHAMIEDISMTPLGADRARLTWQVHLTPVAALKPIGAQRVRRLFSPMFDAFAAGLAKYASQNPVLPDRV